jgi:hypothetical protein
MFRPYLRRFQGAVHQDLKLTKIQYIKKVIYII